jgi:hypothetical protein
MSDDEAEQKRGDGHSALLDVLHIDQKVLRHPKIRGRIAEIFLEMENECNVFFGRRTEESGIRIGT